MRCARAFKRAMTVAALAAAKFALTEAVAQTSLPIRAARWIAPSADPVRALGSSPTECLSGNGDAYLVEGNERLTVPLTAFSFALIPEPSCVIAVFFRWSKPARR